MTAVMFAVVASLLQLPATSADALSCPVGWRLYVDTSGFEGRDVCLLLAPTPMFWNDANTYCQNVAPGGQLLTSAQQTAISVTGTDIMSIATSMLQPHCASGYTLAWIGGQTTVAGTSPVNWYWVDGTPATNVNCGSKGCNMWAWNQPE